MRNRTKMHKRKMREQSKYDALNNVVLVHGSLASLACLKRCSLLSLESRRGCHDSPGVLSGRLGEVGGDTKFAAVESLVRCSISGVEPMLSRWRASRRSRKVAA